MVKGYYLMGSVGLISSSFTVSKVVRDNQEVEDNYNSLFQDVVAKDEQAH